MWAVKLILMGIHLDQQLEIVGNWTFPMDKSLDPPSSLKVS